MLRLTWASPLPPVRSGVSEYSMEVLPGIASGGAEVRLLAPPGWTPPSDWVAPEGVELLPAEARPSEENLLVVHLGNNPYHEWQLPLLSHPRVVAVLHDMVIHHLLVEATLGKGDGAGFVHQLSSGHPRVGEVLEEGRRWGYTSARDPFLFPGRIGVLQGALGTLSHSRWGARLLRQELPAETFVSTVPMGVADPGRLERDAIRLELGVEEEELLLMHLGFLTPAKGLSQVVEGLAAARSVGVRARLVLVGEGDAEGAVQRAARAAGVDGCVSLTGWVATGRLRELPAAADLGVVVRRPSAGETSAAVLRFLACGTPVAVSALPQFLEFPEPAAPRLTPGCEAAELARLLIAAWRDPSRLASRRGAARECFEQEHTLALSAAAYLEVLRSIDEGR